MAADFRFVANAAEGNADELAPQGAGDRFAEAGLAHSRRSGEAEYGALEFLLELAHGQEFENTLLDLLQVVMVLVENLARLFQVEVVLGRAAPGQFHQPVEIGAQHRILGGFGVHRLQSPQLLFRLAFGFGGKLRLLELLPKLGDIFGAGVGLAEFGLDGTQLFAQEIFTLALAHLLLGLGLNAVLHRRQFQFLGQKVLDPPQPVNRVDDLDQRLGIGHLETDIACHQVRLTARIFQVFEHHHDLGRHGLAHADQLRQLIANRPHQGFGLQRQFGEARLVDAFDMDGKIRFFCVKGLQASFGQALDENLHPTVGKLEHPHDHRYRADGKNVFGFRFFFAELLLRRQEDQTVAGQRRIDGGNRFLPADKQRQNHVGENHHVPDGKQGQLFGNMQLFLFVRSVQEFLRFPQALRIS